MKIKFRDFNFNTKTGFLGETGSVVVLVETERESGVGCFNIQ